MARNTKLTKKLQDKICKGLKRGHYLKTAAPLAGVTARSAQSWLAEGRAEDKRIASGDRANPEKAIYLEFLLATEEATSQAVDKALQTLETEIAENPKAAQWYLSHRISGSLAGIEEMEERIVTLEAFIDEALEEKGENRD